MSHSESIRKEHPGFDDILAYVGNRMSEEDAFELETHLGTCDDCVDRVRAHFQLKVHLDEMFEAPGVIEVLVSIPEREPVTVWLSDRLGEFGERIREILMEVPRMVEAALKVVIDTGKKKAKIIGEGLEACCRVESSLRFEHVPSFLERPAVLGDIDEMEGISSVARSRGYPQFEIIADAEEKKLTVIVKIKAEEVGEGDFPLVVLVPEKGGEARVAQLKPSKDTYAGEELELQAEIDDIEGEHILFLESRPPFLGA